MFKTPGAKIGVNFGKSNRAPAPPTHSVGPPTQVYHRQEI